MLEIKESPEVLFLNKLILYVKFTATDDESTFLANSTHINLLMDKVKNAVDEITNNRSKNHSNNLKDYPWIITVLKRKIENIHDWDKFDIKVKTESIKHMAYPFEIDESEISDIISSR